MIKLPKLFITLLLSTGILFALADDNNLSAKKPKKTVEMTLKEAFKKSPSKLLKSIPQKKFLKNFYRHNHYTPLWLQEEKFNQAKIQKLFQNIEQDITLSHESLLYKNAQILNKNIDNNLTKSEKLHTELKLSSLYYNFLLHTIYGEIQWKSFNYKLASLKERKINATWIRYKPQFNISKLMKREDIDAVIKEVTPQHFGYAQLLIALKKMQNLKKNGGWEELPSFKRLALGSAGDIVLKLRKRLKASGDYVECNETNSSLLSSKENNLSNDLNLTRQATFGLCLDKAVKNFQQRHGLVVDGIVGRGTQKALNISVEEKINKIHLNIDRIKQLPRETQARYVVVNIPEFMLHYLENGKTKQRLRVIVGDPRHPTPIFWEKISFIVLNPYWKVPEGIVRREIVPNMIKDPNYLKKQGIEAHRTWSENSRIMDTSSLYWEDYLYGEKFPYRLMQPPGPRNALGKMKFKFPNRFSVYLHDTPTRHLFKKTVRAFSHGCVRLHQPKKLLETIATFNPNIDMNKATKILKGKRKTQLSLKNKLPIYIVYLTAGMNEKGQVEFRNDIYNYDKYQKRRLQ